MNEVDICNLALSYCESRNIDSLELNLTTESTICKIWYNVTRKQSILEVSPNFSRKRKLLPLTINDNAFGFKFAYKKPVDCLRVLGIGEVWDTQHSYSVEGEYIYCDDNYEDGLPVRYISDVEDVNEFSPIFINIYS